MINVYLLATVCFTAYFQIMLKWRMSKLGSLPEDWHDKLLFVTKSLFDPFIISAFTAALFAAMFWMATLTKLDLSSAYPTFLSLSFIMIVVLSGLFLQESFTTTKIIGVSLIFVGLICVNQV